MTEFRRGKGKANGDPNGLAGCPSKYTPTADARAYAFSLLGLTDIELTAAFEISHQTLANWKNNFPSFKAAITRGKQEADARVAEALYKRAIGYRYKETVAVVVGDKLITRVVEKQMPPDTTACRIWLKNRTKRNEMVWSDNFQAEFTGKNGGPIETRHNLHITAGLPPIDFSQLTAEELEMCINIGLKIPMNDDPSAAAAAPLLTWDPANKNGSNGVE